MNTEISSVLSAMQKLSSGVVGVPSPAHAIAEQAGLSEGQIVLALYQLEREGLAQSCPIGGRLTEAGAVVAHRVAQSGHPRRAVIGIAGRSLSRLLGTREAQDAHRLDHPH